MSLSNMTHAELSAHYKKSTKTIQRWKKEGVNIYDEHEVANHSKSSIAMSHSPTGSIHEQIASAQTYDEARFLKTKIEASKAQHALEVSEGSHIKNSEVKEAMIRVLTILKAGMQKQESDLPNKLYGLTAPEIQKELRVSTQGLLAQFNEIAQQEFGQ